MIKSSESSIIVRDIGKCYRINTTGNNGRYRYRSLREEVSDFFTSRVRALKEGAALGNTQEFWAIRGIDFEVKRGETVGIIGRNGAGKSTLLKVLSRITPPTTGQIDLYGRVGSLLEVGTGFHPELSGRENILLNGAILGMSRKEILGKFDEIVAFSEIEKFLDTPVKRYSSGMYVRLAFSVAAHLEPEILIVDEVLAVGDAAFQKRCLDRMEDVGEQGRTVLFVSHNMPSITRLCKRVILLDEGRIVEDGPADKVVGRYLLSGLGTTAKRSWEEASSRPGNHIANLRSVSVCNAGNESSSSFAISEPIDIEIEFEVTEPGHVLVPNFSVQHAEGACVFSARDTSAEWRGRVRERGIYRSRARIPGNLLTEGTHIISVALSTMSPLQVHFSEKDAVAFEVVDDMRIDSARGEFAGSIPGAVRPLLEWRTEVLTPQSVEAEN